MKRIMDKNKPPKPRFLMNVTTALLIFFALTLAYSLITENKTSSSETSLSQVAQDINAGNVASITIEGDKLQISYMNEQATSTAQKENGASLTESLVNLGVKEDKLSAVKIEVKAPSGFSYWFFNLAPFLLPLLFIGIFIWFLTRQVRGAGMQAFSFGQSKARVINPDDRKQRVTFKDIAGVKEAKEELTEVVDFLKNPRKFFEIGARIPKGILLMGAPGTGKTILARAVAGEAGVAFFSISGSEFVEMFVGVGASVVGGTPVLIRDKDGTRLLQIEKFVDKFYEGSEHEGVRPVKDVQTLGVDWARGTKFFKSSNWKKVQSVYRHKVNEIYEIEYVGGSIQTTGDHSVFVRNRNHVVYKKASELKEGDVLVALPYTARGEFLPGFGTKQHIKSHTFPSKLLNDEIVIWSSQIQRDKGLSEIVPRSIATVIHGNQAVSVHTPINLVYKIKITPSLLKLMGYYTAEGLYHVRSRSLRFCFATTEEDLHQDCTALMKEVFGLVKVGRFNNNTFNKSATVLYYNSVPVADFFARYCSTGAHNKHVPDFLWDLPKEYFTAYFEGLVKGDGYINKKGLIEFSSASKQLVDELRWLLAMHGISSSVTKYVQEGGRIIRNGKKPLPDSTMWRLTVGRLTNPFADLLTPRKFRTFSRKPIIKKITKRPYDGYVYDLCGCENEAFFGGEKPLLLHNSRVRDLFTLAKQIAPAIIFIDEIDAVGRVRGAGVGGGNDEREQTLNQILVELDGFEPTEKVIVMAATNRPDVLDPALSRPGRFDRRVVLDLPDRNDREEILKIHSRKKPFAEDVNLRVVAERTPGFSGADLYSLMNEGAIFAARENRTKISQYDLIRAIEKVMLGPERKSHLLSKKEKEITAYHEAGHALVASVLPDSDPVHKISIIARGRAGGYTLKLPFEDRRLQSRREFLDDIAMSLGGYAAEEMVFGDITTGPSNDLQVSTALARDMVTKYGMSEKLGPVALETPAGMPIYGRSPWSEKEYSEKVAAEIDAEVSRIIAGGMKKAKDVLMKYRKSLDAIAKKLIEVETIEREEFEKLLIANGIMPKKNENIGKVV